MAPALLLALVHQGALEGAFSEVGLRPNGVLRSLCLGLGPMLHTLHQPDDHRGYDEYGCGDQANFFPRGEPSEPFPPAPE